MSNESPTVTVSGGAVTVIAAALIAIAVGGFTGRNSPRWLVPSMAAAAIFIVAPLLAALMALAVGAGVWWRRVSTRRRWVAKADDDVVVLAELVSMALSAGLSFPGALSAAADHVHPSLRSEVLGLLRRGRTAGMSWELLQTRGRGERLYRLAARAMATGAPVASSVDMYVNERRHEEKTVAEARARKLPVKLLFPLALLMLPGFLFITVGPTLLGALQRLSF